MEFVNQTPVPARLLVSAVQNVPHRLGVLTAKATFTFDSDGRVSLETQNPLPLLDADQDTECGTLPRDDLPRNDPAFEVLLVGAAHAPHGTTAGSVLVQLRVGDITRELLVFGDRHWLGREAISEPTPFSRMPMCFDRSFGGACEIEVDREAVVEVTHQANRHGRGFDPEPAAKALADLLKPPAGFPRWDQTRLLPNLESPAGRMRRYTDEPEPACWAAVPMDTLLHLRRAVVLPEGKPSTAELTEHAGAMLESSWARPGFFHRAHPDWVIDFPVKGAPVELHGASPHGPIRFALPALSVEADFVHAESVGRLVLAPQMLVLLPETSAFYIVFKRTFQLAPHTGVECSMRLRLEQDWRRDEQEA